MEIFINFLVSNYMWFLVITIVLVFSLIGYIVESKEKKESNAFLGGQDIENNFQALADAAQNKTIGDAMKRTNQPSLLARNTIEVVNQNGNQVNLNPVEMQVGSSMPMQNTNTQMYAGNQMPVQNSNTQMYAGNQMPVQNTNTQMYAGNQMPVQNTQVMNHQGVNPSFEVLGK